ncbi:hypothetical protein FKM82_016196 [Ascaphus truei]
MQEEEEEEERAAESGQGEGSSLSLCLLQQGEGQRRKEEEGKKKKRERKEGRRGLCVREKITDSLALTPSTAPAPPHWAFLLYYYYLDVPSCCMWEGERGAGEGCSRMGRGLWGSLGISQA